MRVLTIEPILAEPVGVPGLVMLHFEQERRAAIPVPHLGGVDAVPARHFPCPEQIEDRGGMRAALCPARRGTSRGNIRLPDAARASDGR